MLSIAGTEGWGLVKAPSPDRTPLGLVIEFLLKSYLCTHLPSKSDIYLWRTHDVMSLYNCGLNLGTFRQRECWCPLPRRFFLFLSANGMAFWRILGTCFNVSVRHVTKVKTESKSNFVCQLVSYLTRRTYHLYHTHKHVFYFYFISRD